MSHPNSKRLLILASKSPRRKTILDSMKIAYQVVLPDIEEHVTGVYYQDIPILNARLKADAVASENPDSLVLAADTVVEFNGLHLNKPADENEAVEMLLTLSGQEHRVVTGVCLQLRAEGVFCLFGDISTVRFKTYSRATVLEYMQKVYVLDKAGAYAVQEHGSLIVDEIIGSVTNVMGLPSEKLGEALQVINPAAFRFIQS